MTTARWATAHQATTTMMIATSKDDDDDDGNGATGNEVDNDGDGAMGYNNDDNGEDNDDGDSTMGDSATSNKIVVIAWGEGGLIVIINHFHQLFLWYIQGTRYQRVPIKSF